MKKNKNVWGFEQMMVLAAFRYCLGRRTYIVGICVDWLIDQWWNFSEKTHALIEAELKAEFKSDDIACSIGVEHRPLGHDMDRQEWDRLRTFINDKP